jgi:hypothetical protein
MLGSYRIVFAFALAAIVALGQTNISRNRSGGGSISPSGGYNATANLDPAPAFLPAPVTGEPYSGEEVIESQQTLSDGTHLTHKIVQARVYRDGQGRTRVEQPILRSNPRGPAVETDPIVEITDPVAGVQYILDVQQHVAHRSAVGVRALPQATGQRPGAIPVVVRPPVMLAGPPTPNDSPNPPTPDRLPALPPNQPRPARLANPPPMRISSAISLGTQIIDGVTVEGLRTTQILSGRAQGFDRDIELTIDTWNSPELRIMMLRKTTDPRFGESTFRLQNFVRGEQDISLFLPPANFVIKDDDGPFSVTYSKP